ncbi:MAG TPA: RHS repeat-associated core domain-containing protein, partial [Candidatus Angelobacter sp.]
SISVLDGPGTTIARTTFGYDETTVVATSGVPQHVAVSAARGNLTSVNQWLNTNNTFLTSRFTYDDTGNMLTQTDPGGHQIQFSYADNFFDGINRNSDAFNTQLTFPDTHSPNLAHHVLRQQFDANTGLRTALWDQNNNQTTMTYDLMRRPLQVLYPDGGQITFVYDNVNQVHTETKVDSSHIAYSYLLMDGYGRTSRRAHVTTETLPYDQQDVCYDSKGQLAFTSYPYQGHGFTDPKVCTGPGDSFVYDAAGRATQLTHSDGSNRQIAYNGRASQMTEESNGSFSVGRIQQTDGLGRLTAVCEVSSVTLLGNGGTPSGCGLDITATGFVTLYSYNPVGDLTSVTQGSLLARSFTYDSLSRLTSESEPEWGLGSTVTYTHNNDGLLTQRTRPAPNQTNPAVTVNTTYAYDELHRLRTRTYSDGVTSQATLNYDEASPLGFAAINTLGLLSSETMGNAQSAFSYDKMQRVLNNWQCIPQTCPTAGFYQLSYAYDLYGDTISATNGVGVTFGYSYNSAPRLTGMTSSLVDAGHPATLLSTVHYNQFGPVSDSLGNGISESFGYNTYGAVQSYTSTPYSFSLGFASNWNITSANDSVNGNWTYSYDQFNRLVSSNKNAGGQTFTYVYDRYGNRLQQNAPQGGPAPQYVFDNSNRIAGSGVTYDALGNETNDGFHVYTYDAENRLIQVDGGTTAAYSYDAEGRRVHTPSYESLYDLRGVPVTLFNLAGVWAYGEIYAGGRHLATYSGATTNFLHSDWLGTKRVMTGTGGANSETCTSLPFGDGKNCTGTDWTFNGFTDYVHDPESNLEHTWFRQLSTTQGRWVSPDPSLQSMDFRNPQSLNRYSRTLNNPLRFLDPLGLACVVYEKEDGSEGYYDDDNPGQTCAQAFADDGGGTGVDGGPPPEVPTVSPDPPELMLIWPPVIDPIGPSYPSFFFVPLTPGTLTTVPNPLPFPGYNYCGPGNAGGSPTNGTDAVCQRHDQCFHDGGFNARMAATGNLSPQQQSYADMCNALLCQGLAHTQPSGFLDDYAQGLITDYFGLQTKDPGYARFCADSPKTAQPRFPDNGARP